MSLPPNTGIQAAMGDLKSNFQDQDLHRSKTPKHLKETQRFIGKELKECDSIQL